MYLGCFKESLGENHMDLPLLEVIQNFEGKYFSSYGIHRIEIYTVFAVLLFLYVYIKFSDNRTEITNFMMSIIFF